MIWPSDSLENIDRWTKDIKPDVHIARKFASLFIRYALEERINCKTVPIASRPSYAELKSLKAQSVQAQTIVIHVVIRCHQVR